MPKNSTEQQFLTDLSFMREALALAEKAAAQKEVPVGALITKQNLIISKAYNLKEAEQCSLEHAEIIAIKKASKALGTWRLTGCTLYVTLEPCILCAGALVASRIDRVVFGASDPKGGALGSLYNFSEDQRLNHNFEVCKGILKEPCSHILKNFFSKKRK